MNQPDLFDVGERTERPKHTATPASLGSGPRGETCGNCKHRIQVPYHTKRYPKCDLARGSWTNGAGSDIGPKWLACREFESKEKLSG